MSEKFKHEPHDFSGRTAWGSTVCVKCGTIAARNAFTQWCMKQGCKAELHPDYERRRRAAGKQ